MGRRLHRDMPFPPMQRAFDIAKRLLRGERLSPDRIAELYGLTRRQSYRIMREIECAFPVVPTDPVNGSQQMTLRLMAAHRERRHAS